MTTRPRLRILGLLLTATTALALLAGCSSKSASGGSKKEPLKSRYFLDSLTGDDDYAEIFDDMTETDRTHSEFQPVMMVHATFWNNRLREAFVKEKAGRFRLTEDEEKTLALEELQENESYIVFIVSAQTTEPEWNDFEQAKSIWRLTLENDDGSIRVLPERIQSISRKDEQSRYFYKRMGQFGRTYRVRFPRDQFRNIKDLNLHISGVRGDVEFEFENDQMSVRE